VNVVLIILVFFFGHWYLSLFTQSFFNHRYAAHQMFTMSKLWEKVFFVLSWAFQGSSYLSPYTYGAMHRAHHAFADTEQDPHSPKFSKNLWDMMWKTKTIYSDMWNRRVPYNERFIKDLPHWWSFDKFADSWMSRLGWGIFYSLFYIYVISIYGGNNYWFLYALLPIHFIMGPFHGAIINWFAHKFGYTNFKVSDTSTNLMPVDILMMGEGFHNNHHAYGADPNFGKKWFEIDPTYQVIKVLNTLSIIKVRK
jgi:stearoyl-CoA desaturase (delta-9 desaturase)